jgi:hypothetical protein
MRQWLLPVVAVVLAVQPALAQSGLTQWQRYSDPEFGFSAQLPGTFAPIPSDTPGLMLREIGGEAQISLYGGPADGMTRDALETRLETGEQIRTITYRAGGDSWFVLSGFYEPTAMGEPVIFYTKVLFSADHATFSAFEISFPERDKPRLEDVVEYFEDNFTRPS